jgi:hypothetical protein
MEYGELRHFEAWLFATQPAPLGKLSWISNVST